MGLRIESTKLWQGERELEQPPKNTRQNQWGFTLKNGHRPVCILRN